MIDLRWCQHDSGNMDGRSQIKVHTDEWTQVHSAQSSLAVTHPSANLAQHYLTSVTESPSKYWSPLYPQHSSPVVSVISLHGQTLYVRRGLLKVSIVRLACGVPQNVLGPLLFILYAANLMLLIEDTQVHSSC